MADSKEFPEKLKGFDKIYQYYDTINESFIAKIKPGEIYVSKNKNELISTLLGSCISVCMRDPESQIGGMNHFMLPSQGSIYEDEKNLNSPAMTYGNWAMEFLINNILKHGGKRRNLELKLFGGSKIMNTYSDVGEKNIKFIKDYVYSENLKVISEDLGGDCPRNIIYNPLTGKVLLKKLSNIQSDEIARMESKLSKELNVPKKSTDIDLF